MLCHVIVRFDNIHLKYIYSYIIHCSQLRLRLDLLLSSLDFFDRLQFARDESMHNFVENGICIC